MFVGECVGIVFFGGFDIFVVVVWMCEKGVVFFIYIGDFG